MSSSRDARWKKYFDGWQLLVVTLVVAWGSALVIVPRPVEPRDLPLPRIEPRAAATIRSNDRELAASIVSTPLDAKIRRLGSAVRLVGRAEADAGPNLTGARHEASGAGHDAIRFSAPEVGRLRAYQTESFLNALATWEATGEENDDLVDLGGSVVRVFKASGWIVEENGKRRVLLPDLALRAAFKRRWNDVAGLNQEVLAVSIDEQRAFLAFAIEHPARPVDRDLGVATGSYQNQMTLNKIDDLAKIDPSYPVLFAKGIVLYRLASYPAAATSFGQYLDEAPSGPYAIRAANFLKASLEKSGGF